MPDLTKEIRVAAEFADRNHHDMTAETVFADGVRLILAAEHVCTWKPKRHDYVVPNMV